MRFEITIDRDLLEKTPRDARCQPLLVLDQCSGTLTRASEATLGTAKVVYGAPRQNGARVWIEAESVTINDCDC